MNTSSYSHAWWLMDMLIDTWEMQAYEAGQPVRFDTPEFIELLKRTRRVAKMLHQAEPSHRNRTKMLPLFVNQELVNSGEGVFNGRREEGLMHTVPFRITADQPELMRAYAKASMIRKGSSSVQELIAYLEHFAPKADGIYSVELFREGVEPGVYDMVEYKESITAGWLREKNEYSGKLSFAPRRTWFVYEASLMKFCMGKLSAEKLAKKINVRKDDPN